MIESNVSTSDIGKTPTKDRLLDAAETLFAEQGFEATSLRQITSKAQVNLASVNYHFHSKDDLIRAVFERRIRPLNQRRLEALKSCLDAAGDGPVPLEEIIRAFVRPVLQMRREPHGAAVGRLFGRTYADPSGSARQAFFELMKEISRPFTEAFRRALPGLDQVELVWRMHFSVGVMAHTLAGSEHLKVISGGLCDLSDVEGALDRIVAYVAAGLRAAPAGLNRS